MTTQVCNNCTEIPDTCDTTAVNPGSGSRTQRGYRLDSGASLIGMKLTQMTLRLNNTVSATGTLGIYAKDTKVGTLDVSTITGSYADFAISCSGSPTLAQDDVIWWENDVGRSGNINTKIIDVDFTNPEGYTAVENDNDSYGVAPSTPITNLVGNMCFTGSGSGGSGGTFMPPPIAHVRL